MHKCNALCVKYILCIIKIKMHNVCINIFMHKIYYARFKILHKYMYIDTYRVIQYMKCTQTYTQTHTNTQNSKLK